jgi:hypothetical protein
LTIHSNRNVISNGGHTMQEIKRLHTNDRMSQAVLYGGATASKRNASPRLFRKARGRPEIRVEIQVVATA